MKRDLKNDQGEIIGFIETDDPTAYCPDLEADPLASSSEKIDTINDQPLNN